MLAALEQQATQPGQRDVDRDFRADVEGHGKPFSCVEFDQVPLYTGPVLDATDETSFDVSLRVG